MLTDKRILEAIDELEHSQNWEEWNERALRLDSQLNRMDWRNKSHDDDKLLNADLLQARVNQFQNTITDDDLKKALANIRSGMVRNLGGVMSPRLYSQAFSGTKFLIDEYINKLADIVKKLRHSSDHPLFASIMPQQNLIDFVHDSRQACGRTCLVLEGGHVYGFIHLGVIRALFMRGLLPRIISGSSIGALIAALICCRDEDELPSMLDGPGIDLRAFGMQQDDPGNIWDFIFSIPSLFLRWLDHGHFLDPGVLEDCVNANVGDLTFEEAYEKSKRILNIPVFPNNRTTPIVFNHLNTPAAVSSVTRPDTVLLFVLTSSLSSWYERLHLRAAAPRAKFGGDRDKPTFSKRTTRVK